MFGRIFEMTSFWYHFSTKKVVEYHKHAFSRSLGNSGGDLEEQGLLNSGIPKLYSSRNRSVKKWPGLRERGPRGSPWHP